MLLTRAVLREVGTSFFVSLATTTGIAFFILTIGFFKRTPGVGLGFLVEVFPLFFPLALQFTMPLALLTAVVTAFGRMAGDGELTALAASGVPLMRTVRPVLAVAAVLALAALLLTDYMAPLAAGRLRAAKRDLIQRIQTSFRAGLSELDLGRGRISFESFTGDRFRDICIEYRRDDERHYLLRGKSGTIAVTPDERVVVSLEDARATIAGQRPGEEILVQLDEGGMAIDLTELTSEKERSRKRGGLQAWELAYAGGRGYQRADKVRITSSKADEELARRTALAASTFFFAFIGIPLGVLSGKAGKTGAFLLSIAPVLIVYFPIVILASNVARTGAVPAYPALWLGNVVLLLLGGALLWRLNRR